MCRTFRRSPAVIGLVVVLALSSCATLDDMAAALANLQRLKFRIGSVRDFRLLGIEIAGKARLSDFGAADILKIGQSYASRKLPVELVVDVLAVNPNDGTGGTTKSTSTLTSLECRLLIDDKPTVTGNIDAPVEIPGTGQESAIPIRLTLDLLEFFGDKRYEDLIALALAIGGRGGSAARVALDAQPTVSTPLGPITYPGRVTIVSTEFR
ncbi:MAG: hypothetical protein H6P95_232 [Candidatus Aminicenantes bacterium]|nr:hypothetical protein [Candidatus Aminicenantes bacterium]